MSHSHTHSHKPASLDARYREVRKVTLIGAIVDLVLGIVKIVVGYSAASQALIADGVHSLSDLATDFLVLFAAKHSHREADAEHPYGHGRIETVATVALGVALLAVAAGICYEAVARLLELETLPHPGVLALVIALLSVASKEAIYQYTVRVARRLRSNMLHANAWHSRTDAISSIVVVIGVGGAMLGYPYLDGMAAVVVAVMIAKIGWDLVWSSLKELIDTSLDDEQLREIRELIMEVTGVRALHMLRTRRSGSQVLVDVHILVDPELSVSEGHQIGERVRGELIGNLEEVTDVTVHIDPEDDELASPCDQLPMRDEVLRRLEHAWQDLDMGQGIDRVVLHYLDGKVHVDVFIPMEGIDPDRLSGLSSSVREAASRAEDIGKVNLYFQ
jgi:cation diffusion facilitator family transporter